jgi:hypothetical protein
VRPIVLACASIALSGCSSPPRVAGTQAARILHLSFPGTDSSCLERKGGTYVGDGLSDDDVATIERLIRQSDSLPIIAIEPLPPVSTRQNQKAASFEASTGVACHGHLSGHGGIFRLKKADGTWHVASKGSWVS